MNCIEIKKMVISSSKGLILTVGKDPKASIRRLTISNGGEIQIPSNEVTFLGNLRTVDDLDSAIYLVKLLYIAAEARPLKKDDPRLVKLEQILKYEDKKKPFHDSVVSEISRRLGPILNYTVKENPYAYPGVNLQRLLGIN